MIFLNGIKKKMNYKIYYVSIKYQPKENDAEKLLKKDNNKWLFFHVWNFKIAIQDYKENFENPKFIVSEFSLS